jgi:hypothetical protein
MHDVPGWIGFVGLVLMLILCGAFLGGQLWFAIFLLIPCFALVVLENRYERALMGTRSER